MPLTVTISHYANPDLQHGTFRIGDEVIGRAHKVAGGWRLTNGRRVYATDEAAAAALLEKQIAAARRQEMKARKQLNALAMYCGGRLPKQ